MTTTAALTATDFKVADLDLADFGRKEITLAEHEMPGLMALRDEFAASQPLELGGAVEAIAGLRARRHDQPGALDVPKHPRRPSRGLRRLVDGQRIHRRRTLSRACQGLARRRQRRG